MPPGHDGSAVQGTMRLLLAEDDALLGRATCLGLEQAGCRVDWVTTGAALLQALEEQAYDCVLLDLGLPDLAGAECLRKLRSRRVTVPVIVLTACAERTSRIDLLDTGADDYLVKPFDLDEVAARVRAVVRRGHAAQSELGLSYGPLRLRPLDRTVAWRGTVTPLSTKEFWVLEALVRQRGRPLTRHQLEQALYGWDEAIGSNAIEVHVHNLRRKLHPGVVLTVRGIGYQMGTAETLEAATPPVPGPAAPR